jgi:DNA-binding NarL/FixJ family response regulator
VFAPKTARILIIDDHEVLREGLKALLGKLRPGWSICGEGSDGDEAVSLAQSLKPDLVILDITMPTMSGLEASTRIRALGLNVPILIFTTHHSEMLEADVRNAGAQGYVLKSQAARNLVLAIDTIFAGGTFFGSSRKPEPDTDREPNSGILQYRALLFAF